jgi:hypothetical protein
MTRSRRLSASLRIASISAIAAERVRGLRLGRSSMPETVCTASPIQIESLPVTGLFAADQSTATYRSNAVTSKYSLVPFLAGQLALNLGQSHRAQRMGRMRIRVMMVMIMAAMRMSISATEAGERRR